MSGQLVLVCEFGFHVFNLINTGLSFPSFISGLPLEISFPVDGGAASCSSPCCVDFDFTEVRYCLHMGSSVSFYLFIYFFTSSLSALLVSLIRSHLHPGYLF